MSLDARIAKLSPREAEAARHYRHMNDMARSYLLEIAEKRDAAYREWRERWVESWAQLAYRHHAR